MLLPKAAPKSMWKLYIVSPWCCQKCVSELQQKLITTCIGKVPGRKKFSVAELKMSLDGY